MIDILCEVNGSATKLQAREDDTLMHLLRNQLGLKGTRFGCGQEQCGSCMVLVNGAPTYACTYQARDVQGKTVTTIEGLASGDSLHPVQQAFLDEQAGQCGYCLSGIIISAKALLDGDSDPSRAQIVAALEPHLCRCGAHQRMLRSVERAAEALREASVR